MKRALIYILLLLGCGQSTDQLATSLAVNPNLKKPDKTALDLSHHSHCLTYQPSRLTNSNVTSSDTTRLPYCRIYKEQDQLKIILEGCKYRMRKELSIDIADSSFVMTYTWIGESKPVQFTTIEQELTINKYPIEYGDTIIGLLSYKGIALRHGSKIHKDLNGMFYAIVSVDTSITYHSISEWLPVANYVQKLKLTGSDEISSLGQFKHLKQLEITDRTHSGEFPEAILNLAFLEDLHLSCNISYIPEQIDQLTRLKRLDLCGNDALNELPSSLSGCQQLRELNLRQNKRINIATLQGLDNLNYLNLAETNLPKLPNGLTTLQKLKILDLSGNHKLNLASTLSELSDLKSLTELHLRYCDIKTLPSSILSFKHLKKLDLSWNPLTEKELQRVKCELPNTEIVFFTDKE